MLPRGLSQFWFKLVHGHNLVYNTCWEDPRLDREGLQLGPDDRLVTITSAGCNVLDYALLGPAHIDAVDVNPRQNALLQLKLAGIRTLDYETFFALFGVGRLACAGELYWKDLRAGLPEFARRYWDSHIRFFTGRGARESFYFCGTAGYFARTVNRYLDRVARVREAVEEILEVDTVEQQREIYERRLRGAVWTRLIRWIMNRDAALSFLGVPLAQREQLERDYRGGVAQFVEDCVETVFTRLPLRENYFWRVYLTGSYTPECCPEYLKRENFERLKGGLANRISTHTGSLLDFLHTHEGEFSRFVLLDHMDWLAANRTDVLEAEWQAIIDRAAPESRVLWRSGSRRTDFVDAVPVHWRGRNYRVGDLLTYDRELAARLHAQDRVHTYGSFAITRLAT